MLFSQLQICCWLISCLGLHSWPGFWSEGRRFLGCSCGVHWWCPKLLYSPATIIPETSVCRYGEVKGWCSSASLLPHNHSQVTSTLWEKNHQAVQKKIIFNL